MNGFRAAKSGPTGVRPVTFGQAAARTNLQLMNPAQQLLSTRRSTASKAFAPASTSGALPFPTQKYPHDLPLAARDGKIREDGGVRDRAVLIADGRGLNAQCVATALFPAGSQ